MKLPSFIRQLVRCCDSESSRYALGGVKCESASAMSTVTATDGRQLVTVSYADDPGTGTVDTIIDGKSLAKAVAAVAAKNTPVKLDGATVCSRGGHSSVQVIEGRFPRYEDVFGIYEDDPADYVCTKLDPDLLGKLCDVFSATQGDSASKGVDVWVKDCSSPVYFARTTAEGECIRAVLMPLAADDPDAKVVSFPAKGVTAPVESGGQSETHDESPAVIEEDGIACVGAGSVCEGEARVTVTSGDDGLPPCT
jgi:hypothetical protein